jgi:hypothetical protein
MNSLERILSDALERKPCRLSFETTYDHKNMFDWLKTFLPDWTIVIPDSSCSAFALSDWPTGITRKCVKEWLQEMNHQSNPSHPSNPSNPSHLSHSSDPSNPSNSNHLSHPSNPSNPSHPSHRPSPDQMVSGWAK